MSMRSALTRLAIVTAAGALAATAAVTPALGDDWDGDGGNNSTQGGDDSYDWLDQGGGGGGGGQGDQNAQGNPNAQSNQNTPNGQSNPNGQTWQNGQGGQGGQGGNWQSGEGGGGGNGGDWQSGGGDGGGNWQSVDHNDSRRYRGRVTASELLLRSAPDRGSQVIRVARRGEIVSIFCRTPGQNVQGNSVWYLLTDGTWAWGAARYIDVIGTTPRWC
ncbi:SH3 domain-containing protein [Streptomyces sp. NPDC048481]|uniref:SH3 domain-containing protein n=1 Tax=Streptomyces sp. NPDC048481 TaxID=3365557 RepID=UPI00371F3AC5